MVRKPKPATSNKDELQAESSGLSSKKESSTVIRRSGRLTNINTPSGNQEIQPFVEIDVIEDDTSYTMNDGEVPRPSERSLEDKVDRIREALDKLKSKASGRYPQVDKPTTDLDFKKLYFDAQKKIEILMKENYELTKKLEVAPGKLEVHRVTNSVWSAALEQVKDVCTIPDLPKATRKRRAYHR